MDLYLLRHAVAVEREDFHGHDDSERPLAPEGKKKMSRAAKGMRALGLSFDLIFSSPYVRARDTADLVAHAFTNRWHLKLTDLLTPAANQRRLVRQLATFPRAHSILLAGHEPQLSTLLATLLGAAFPVRLKLRKGALCLLTVEKLRYGPCARMEWLLTSKQLGSIALQPHS